MSYTAAAAAISLVVSVLLVGGRGATGVAAGLCVGLVIATVPLVAIVARRLLGLGAGALVRALTAPALAVAAAAAVFGLGRLLTAGFGGAVAAGAIGVVAYAGVIARWVLDDRERTVLGGLLPARLRGGLRGAGPAATLAAPEGERLADPAGTGRVR